MLDRGPIAPSSELTAIVKQEIGELVQRIGDAALQQSNSARDAWIDQHGRRSGNSYQDCRDAYDAGLAAGRETPGPSEQPAHTCVIDNDCAGCKAMMARWDASTRELIARLRRSVTAGIFGIPPEAIDGIQADISELEKRIGGERG